MIYMVCVCACVRVRVCLCVTKCYSVFRMIEAKLYSVFRVKNMEYSVFRV